MSDQNWRTDTDASDYFLHQKKRLQIADRRPVIWNGADLVGPGIGPSAVRLTDFNDTLATFNGYYSAAQGAANAPNMIEAFVGHVISDSEFGGRQVFSGLTTGAEFSRTFTRSPEDPESLGWSDWAGQRIKASVDTVGVNPVTVASGGPFTILPPPNLADIGQPIYETSEAGVVVTQQGVYTGVIQVGYSGQAFSGEVVISKPVAGITSDESHTVVLDGSSHFPFTVWVAGARQEFINSGDRQGFAVSVRNTSGSARTLWWKFSCTRIGDAV